MGWILVLFDLPVPTDTERKSASRFRKDLLDSGYLMIQFSIYARPCVSHEQMDTHIARVKAITPEAGNVRLMFITDEHWGKSVNLGTRGTRGKTIGDGMSFTQQGKFPAEIFPSRSAGLLQVSL